VHVPHRENLRRVPASPHGRSSDEWPPRAVPVRMAEGVSEDRELDLRCLGLFLHAHAPPAAVFASSPAALAFLQHFGATHCSFLSFFLFFFFFFFL
jgi:hypothetical protein